MKKEIFIFITSVFVLVSCNRHNTEILYGKSFGEMKELAAKENKPFCIVLGNADCPPCSLYIENLSNKNKQLTASSFFNIVDVSKSENEWFRQWISSAATPATCIFSSNGELKAVVSGAAAQCMDCIRSVLKGDAECSGYLYSKHFQSYNNGIPTLNTVLQCKLRLEKGENIEPEITETLNNIVYPYNIYLKCLNAKKTGDSEQAVALAEWLLTFHDTFNLRMYGKLFTEAKYIINPDYKPENDAILAVQKEMHLNDCLLNVPHPFTITVKNEGSATLSIHDISTSCSCVSLKGSKQYTIEPEKSEEIAFEFTADHEGEILREITIASNAVNAIEMVTVTAMVIKQKI
jgi:hypothetical protein